MKKYRKKPVVIEAEQWFTGDMPEIVSVYSGNDDILGCMLCGKLKRSHGWVDTLEGGHIVCPGDFIIKGVAGEFYPIKKDIFEKTYEAV